MFSPALDTGQAYVDVLGTWDEFDLALDELYGLLVGLLEDLYDDPACPDALADLCQEAVVFLEEADLEESTSELPPFLSQLEVYETRFASFELAHYLDLVRARRERERLEAKVDQDIPDEVLESGHLSVLIALVDEVFHGEGDNEAAVEVMAQLSEKLERQRVAYEQTPMRPEEWTSKVALADELIQHGLELWQQGLEGLAQSCLAEDESAAVTSLEELRQANRCLIKVELLKNP